MYRFLLSLLLVAAFGVPAHAQLFSEDFGTGFDDFYFIGNPNWECYDIFGNSTILDCASSSDPTARLFGSDEITTADFAIPAGGATLTFNYAFAGFSNYPTIEVNTTGSCFGTYTSVSTLSAAYSCTGETVDLSAYAGQTIRIRFQSNGSTATFVVDDIEVTGSGGGGGGGSCATVFEDDFPSSFLSSSNWSSSNSISFSSFGACSGNKAVLNGSSDRMITTDIDLTGASSAEFTMEYSISSGASFTFYLPDVDISTVGGSSWTDVGPSYASPSGSCQTLTVDLTTYTGSTVRLRISDGWSSYPTYITRVEVCSDSGGGGGGTPGTPGACGSECSSNCWTSVANGGWDNCNTWENSGVSCGLWGGVELRRSIADYSAQCDR